MAYTTIDKPTDYFNTKLYTGTGATQSITGVGFQPDMNWCKLRTTAYNHVIVDAVRGVTKVIRPNLSNAEDTYTNAITSFDSDGFTLGADTNGEHNRNGDSIVSWNWKAGGTGVSNTDGSINSTVSANTTSGFSIATYTGNGSSGSTIGHGLNAVPEVVLIKRRNQAMDWNFQLGYSQYLKLNSNDQAIATSGGLVGSGSTSTITVDANAYVNASGSTYVGYFFVSKKGYSKFGSYTGNGNADGTFVYTGFKPALVIVKRTDSSANGNWTMHDNKRSSSNGFNHVDKTLYPNQNYSEDTSTARGMDLLSNGFKFTGTDEGNTSGATHIFMAFAENPFVTSTGIPTTAR